MKIRNLIFILLIITEKSVLGQIDRSSLKNDYEIDKFYGSEAIERGAKSQHEALAEWAKEITSSVSKPPSESIPFLGNALLKLSKKNIFQVSETIAVYDSAKKALMSIPGHAQYFSDKIKIEQESVKNDPHLRGGRLDYDRNRGTYISEILINLPSPETIRVLGDFLDDDLDYRCKPNTHRGYDFYANSDFAMKALVGIGLNNSPQIEKFTDQEHDIALWRSWYAKVKAGTLTFSFVGDPTEYDLNGPAPREKLQRIVHDQQRDEGRVAGHTKAAAKTELAVATSQIRKPFQFAGILAACSIIAIAVWYFLRSYGLKKNQ
jgi:hypothetical protein